LQWVGLDELHENAVAADVVRLGNGEAVLEQDLHERKLFHRCQARQIQPRCTLAVPQVVTIVLDAAERRAPQPIKGGLSECDLGPHKASLPVHLECALVSLGIGDNVDVCLFV